MLIDVFVVRIQWACARRALLQLVPYHWILNATNAGATTCLFVYCKTHNGGR
ncbi:hypothetical protein QKQ66_gp035 [Dione juno nucleopolyhedrovirus]|uniref:Uncharacterized protein n=1 Tax=Dione juno nucleopolyhedrovirus TaxID=2594175 RepID=A0AAE6H445_9ABAC|nr:hypothetical protein QKQ66_gp035 [Dione juno nucleopolyhedrovirus]QDL57022.1 hypothetical protein DijuNPV-ORF-35 [Dione juno nucleopolyhedrovirus]